MDPQKQNAKGNYLIIVNRCEYSYIVNPFVLTNSLGFVRAQLKEYIITGPGGDCYKLYKTTERNWYDVENANPNAGIGLLRDLKLAIDTYETSNE